MRALSLFRARARLSPETFWVTNCDTFREWWAFSHMSHFGSWRLFTGSLISAARGEVIFDISLDGSSYLYWYFYCCFEKVLEGTLLISSILTVKILLWHHQTNFCQNFISFIFFTTFQHFLLTINSKSPISCPEIVCLWQKITFSSLKPSNRKENGNRTTFANLCQPRWTTL